jgi:hypothetical protein
MFIVYQVSGVFQSDADRALRLCHEFRYAEAAEILRRYNPRAYAVKLLQGIPADGERTDDVWWLYNIDRAINRLPDDVWETAIKNKYRSVSLYSETFYRCVCQTAERMKGGKWDFFYEY